ADSDALMQAVMKGPTNWLSDRATLKGGVDLSLADYQIDYGQLPLKVREAVEARWGKPESDPFYQPGEVDCGRFKLSVLQFGNVVVGVQPARGYNIDPTDSYHSPDLVPPHNYFAFYFWLRHQFRAQAIVHMGKHGNLEWLPGKSVALSETCFPEATLGPMPHVYPFIVNDPGEGTQAKRRAQAVIIGHLTPPLTRAESYGPLRDLEALVDEYYVAAGVDPRRLDHLRREILSLTSATGLDVDVGMSGSDETADLARLDAYLCELKEAQIRDGLHVFGTSPEGSLERDLVQALVRIPRGTRKGGDASLQRAIADDLDLGFDPLDCDMAANWSGARPDILARTSTDTWRTAGDTVERIEALAGALIEQAETPEIGPATTAVLEEIRTRVLPTLRDCGRSELQGLLSALEGRFVPPAPSGAPTRGRLDVLPTGRNFYSVDSRAVPTPTAWKLGWKSANLLIEKHLQDHGDWPRAMLLTAWGTANMRTGGDDIAQALALMGVKPQWDSANRRVTGFEILPLSVLDRPRVDVTLRISGFFRDAFPQLIDLVDSAARAVMALDEPADMNPAARRARNEGEEGQHRVFGSKPGAYGAGLQALIDERLWNDKADLAEAYLEWGSYAYGAGTEGKRARAALQTRLGSVEAIVQNQDNREHDLLDSDDYYQFEGGAAAAVFTLQGQDRPIYHNDHSRPERPVIRTLEDEIGRVVRARVVNPKWIDGVKRHGYKGAFEIAATVDYMFAFAATTGAVKSHHFDLVHQAFLEDDETREFIADHNAPALAEIAERLSEAIKRGLWVPRSNSARTLLKSLTP
ncbi:MAG: cobaltochelatase subunit CobN, partial [Paracoccaceae bacterium]